MNTIPTNGIKVFSAFNGMNCARIALDKLNIKVDKYYSSEIDKYAIQVTQHNHPDTIQLGDIRNIKGSDLGFIDLICGGSPCFIAGTKVITDFGYSNIENIKIGDLVLTHKNRFKKVLKIGGVKSKQIWKLKAQGVKETFTTEDHPYFVREVISIWDNTIRRYVKKYSEPIWKKIKDIKKTDCISILKNANSTNKENLTNEECFILGRYLADGHTRKDYKVSENRPNDRHWQLILSIGNDKLDYFKKQVQNNHFSCYKHGESIHRCVFSNKRLVEIVEKYIGVGSKEKYISNLILDLPIDLLICFLNGYISGDGCKREFGYRITTISEKLAMSFGRAVLKCYDTNCSFEFSKRKDRCIIEERTVNQNDTYSCQFDTNKTKHLFEIIDGIMWTPVKSVIKTELYEQVFNIEVEEDNSYTANNAIVHNCQGFSMAGKMLNFDDPRSKLFFEFVRIYEELRTINPDIKFLLENVRMQKWCQDVISRYLGAYPIQINSNLVSAQNRERWYWTNIQFNQKIKDKGLLLRDILESQVNEKHYLSDKLLSTFSTPIGKDNTFHFKHIFENEKCPTITSRYHKMGRTEPYLTKRTVIQINPSLESGGKQPFQQNRIYDSNGISPALCANLSTGSNNIILNERQRANHKNEDEKANTFLSTSWKGSQANGITLVGENKIRRLTPIECERLQTVPDNFTSIVNDTQRYRMLGNGWTVDVIAHIFQGLKEDIKTNNRQYATELF